MSQKISDKLLAALRHLGVPDEFASGIADSVDFMGESDEDSAERDNYEIVIIAKAVRSLMKRHSFQAEAGELFTESDTDKEDVGAMSDSNGNTLDDITNEFSHTADYPITEKRRENEKFWKWLGRLPKFLRDTAAFTLPTLTTLAMVLLTLTVVGLTAALILLVLAVTVAGIASFFIGLIYGVTQFSTFPAAAYYEMGLGLALGGGAALLVVLMYYTITKLLPMALKAGIRKLYGLIVKMKKFKMEMRQSTAKADGQEE